MQKKSKTNFSSILLYGAMLLLGAGIMYFIANQYNIFEKETPIDRASVEKINGLYVFIESSPIVKYETIQKFKGDNLADIYNKLGIGKQKAGQVILNIINTANENLNFSEVLNTMVNNVHDKYPDATGVIFRNRMKECEVIKLRE